MRAVHKMGGLAEWADRRVVPAALISLLVVDALVGLNWTLSPKRNLSSPAYDVGERIMSLDGWGALFLILAAAAAVVYAVRGRRWFSGYIVGGLLAGVWGFWTVLFFTAPMGRSGASYTLAALAFGMCLLHALAGLASTHRVPVAPSCPESIRRPALA